MIKRLEAASLVRRERSALDERSVHVHLTDEGTGLRQRALLVPRRISAATRFELEEIADLHARLDRIAWLLGAALVEETPGCGAS
ncbi:hypothetical protein ACIBJF_40790 [Streptomyces sp. NPDC050743]|uniref:transcriptional regulator, SarA/Rot family n=1 Tax=Streptomyces sp. NPDC050743 TaxID=3365634 RepID=UPI003787708F